MRKRILIYLSVGFVIGMAMVLLIPAIFNRTVDGTIHFYSERLLSRFGSPTGAMLITLVLFGLYGAGCIGGMLLYEIERWSLALATAVHYLIVSLGYALAASLLCWGLTTGTLLLIEGMMTAGFILIWLIMYLIYKRQVRELNELNEKRREDNRYTAGKER